MDLSIDPVDLAVFLTYLVVVVGLGWFVGGGAKTLGDYLLGNRSLPWWAILGSIVATETSTVTFLSIPGLTFAEGGNLSFLQLTIGFILGRILVALLLLPRYFRGSYFSAYEVLEKDYGVATKRVASVLFLIARNAGDALRLFLTALVLEAMFDVSITLSIVMIGFLTILYTLLGGMKAVIWNDCLQLLVYLLGGALILWVIASRLPEGLQTVVDFGRETERLVCLDLGLDFSKPLTLWAGLFGGIFLSLGTHGADQMLVQRYLAAKSRAHASAALIASGFVVLLQFAFFLFLGIALAAYENETGWTNSINREVPSDQALAFFVVEELPTGVGLVGLILAGVFAAAMSTLSSSLNSSATVFVRDFLSSQNEPPSVLIKRSRIWTAGFGILQMGIAIAASGVTRSVISEVLAIAGMTVGLLLGLFALSSCLPRSRQVDAIGGLLTAAVALLAVKFVLPDHGIVIAWPWFALIGATTTVAIGFLLNQIAMVTRST